ncbi:hypothetical protein ACFFGT_04095 [Mucilaginibacter angelicae]|uniref:Carboxypeptidase-like regulatory domain-containing protein n=1 Tax=Mucilaginibacter angelicae TaxID=869718 RepID=A0ABV6L286_9SPHI
MTCCFSAIFLLATGSFAYGQDTEGIVSGNLIPLAGATIKNLTSKKFVISDENGKFKLAVKTGDTLTASYIGFITDTLVVFKRIPLVITLQPQSNLLREVFIRSRTSPLEKFKKNQSDYKQIYRIGDDRHIFSLGGGYGSAGLAINIDALYSALSKEGRNARRLQKVLVRDYHSDIVDSRFTESLVAKVTGYEGEQLDRFMINNRPAYDFIKKASDYDLIKYIQQKAREMVSQKDSTAGTAKK